MKEKKVKSEFKNPMFCECRVKIISRSNDNYDFFINEYRNSSYYTLDDNGNIILPEYSENELKLTKKISQI